MPPWLSVTILVVLGAALLLGMAKGWRRLRRGPSEVPAYLFDRFLDLMRDPSAGAAAAGQATDVTDSPKGA
jgi:hypothetical protein